MKKEDMKSAIERLKQKIADNYAEYRKQWLKLSPEELIDQCETIAAITRVSKDLPSEISDDEARYLLRFKDPLGATAQELSEYFFTSLDGEKSRISVSEIIWDMQESRCAEEDFELEDGFESDDDFEFEDDFESEDEW